MITKPTKILSSFHVRRGNGNKKKQCEKKSSFIYLLRTNRRSY